MAELVGQHERIDAPRSCSGSKGAREDMGMDRLADVGRVAQTLDQVRECVLVERLVVAAGAQWRKEDPATARSAAEEAPETAAQVGR